MCGITGFYSSTHEISIESLHAATNAIAHRGPDGQGIFYKNNIGLGHTRLSIIDLSNNASQPMHSINNNLTIVFNGEIYNYRELKLELQSAGYNFKNNSDTEVIIVGYEHWGTGIFQKLNGIFSIAIWDNTIDKLILVRDRFGVKPLYLYYDNNQLFFGSEIKSILAFNNYNKQISKQGFHEFLYFGNALGENTLFQNIKKLTPGHWIEFDATGAKESVFWKHEDVIQNNGTIAESINTTSFLLENAVKRQLISDVPVGVFLSGGVDSTAITAFASKHYSGKIKTFTAGFDFADGHDELSIAATSARLFNTEHHELKIQGADIIDTINTLVMHHDEPFSDAANIPLYLLTKELKSTCKVILQGDGADELFGGYSTHELMSNYSLYKTGIKALLPIKKFIPSLFVRTKLDRFSPLFSITDLGRFYARLLSPESDEINPPTNLLSDEVKQIIITSNPFTSYKKAAQRFSYHHSRLQQLLWIDSMILLPDQFLEKVDKSTMANGIEIRVPFLDNDLASFALSLPSNYKMLHGHRKHILKKSLEGIVPNTILNARKKGFGVPYHNWLRGPLYEFMCDNLLEKNNKNFLNLTEIENRIKAHKSNEWNWGITLWKLLNFTIWKTKYNMNF